MPLFFIYRLCTNRMDSSEQQVPVDGMVSDACLWAGQDEPPGGISVEEMTAEDIRTILRWTTVEGRNPAEGDAEAYFTADEKRFFMAKTASGDHVASVSGVRYSEDCGFVVLYICLPKHRGKGYGKFTFGYAIRHLGERVIGIDAVEAQCSNYAKWGFVAAYENIRFVGIIDLEALPPEPLPTDEVGERVVVKGVNQNRLDAILDSTRSTSRHRERGLCVLGSQHQVTSRGLRSSGRN